MPVRSLLLLFLFFINLNVFFCSDGRYAKKTLVFVERKRTADFIATYLSQVSIHSTSIHG